MLSILMWEISPRLLLWGREFNSKEGGGGRNQNLVRIFPLHCTPSLVDDGSFFCMTYKDCFGTIILHELTTRNSAVLQFLSWQFIYLYGGSERMKRRTNGRNETLYNIMFTEDMISFYCVRYWFSFWITLFWFLFVFKYVTAHSFYYVNWFICINF